MKEETASGQQRWKSRRIKVKINGFRSKLFLFARFYYQPQNLFKMGKITISNSAKLR